MSCHTQARGLKSVAWVARVVIGLSCLTQARGLKSKFAFAPAD